MNSNWSSALRLSFSSRRSRKRFTGNVSNKARRKVVDREFLPAALEILETPVSPITSTLLITICALFAGTITWSYFGWLDIYAVAPGKVRPHGGSKVVQSLEAGKVEAVNVKNGQKVKSGDTLIKLDDRELTAECNAQRHNFEVASAEASRRTAAIASSEAA